MTADYILGGKIGVLDSINHLYGEITRADTNTLQAGSSVVYRSLAGNYGCVAELAKKLSRGDAG
jgi:hypothetical protein